MDDLFGFDAANADWKPLYKIGAFAALIAVIVFRRYIAAELAAFNGFGIFNMPEMMPGSALDWFTLLQHDGVVGLFLVLLAGLIILWNLVYRKQDHPHMVQLPDQANHPRLEGSSCP